MNHRASKLLAAIIALCGSAVAPLAAFAQTASENTDATETLQTIVVTAEKRRESSLDVPMSITALSGAQLQNDQSFRFDDFVGTVPGLTFLGTQGGGGELVIRGLTTGGADINTGVAVYVDDTPLTPNSSFANPQLDAADLDTYDMQRIEVLKGPQGTLYGANALGGLLKYVTNAPDPSGFSAGAETGLESIYNGNLGFDAHGMLNVPIADNLAVRFVGYDNYYPGFIDDPSRGLKDINTDRYDGGRVSVLYDVTETFSIRLNALYQNRTVADYGNGAEDVNPITLSPINGRLTQERLIDQPSSVNTQLYNGTINWDLGFAKLLSATSYQKFSQDTIADYTPFYGLQTFGGASYGLANFLDDRFHTTTEELRLTSRDAELVTWQVGEYFTTQDSSSVGAILPISLSPNQIVYNFPVNLIAYVQPATYREYSEYADVDWHITPTVDFDAGGRYSSNHQTFALVSNGVLSGPIDIAHVSSQDVFTYSGDLRWHVTHEHMLYARVAEGYVPGGPNNTFPGSTLPNSFQSSTTLNYEVGVKSSMLDDRFTAQISVFDIEWRNIQLAVLENGFTGNDNGGKARSQGVEWDFDYIPINGLTLGLNGAYTDAYLTEAIPSVVSTVGANVGDRLPFVPFWQSSANARYEWGLWDGYRAFTGVNWKLEGLRRGNFEPPALPVGVPASEQVPLPLIGSSTQQQIPGFQIWDVRMGVTKNQWTATLYAKNIGNTRGITYLYDATGTDTLGQQSAVIYPPRIIGFSIAASF